MSRYKLSKRSRMARAFKSRNLHRALKGVAGATAFVTSIAGHDSAAVESAQGFQKLKVLANIITGRMGGVNLFSDAPKYAMQTNPGQGLNNIIRNPWVQFGIGTMIASALSKYSPVKIPYIGKIASYGKQVAFWGGLGAYFDPPGNGSQQVSNTPQYQYGTVHNY